MPIGAYLVGLSPTGRDVLDALVNTKNISSPTAEKLLVTLPLEEQVPVLEGVIGQLRQVTDWTRNPKGFAGACLLARHSNEAAKILVRYLQEFEWGGKPPAWMNVLLKDEQWNKEKQ